MTKNNKFNLWEYFYYRATLFYSKMEKGLVTGDNKSRAAFYVGFCILLNFELIYLSISFLISLMSENRDQRLEEGKIFYYVLTVAFVTTIIISLYYFANRRSDSIFKKYENETREKKRYRGLLVFTYIVGTFLMLILVGYLNRKLILGI